MYLALALWAVALIISNNIYILQVLGSTLILTWIPNSTLHRNPRSIENSPGHQKISPRRSPRQEYSKSDAPTSGSASNSPQDSLGSEDSAKKNYVGGADDDGISVSSSSSDLAYPGYSSKTAMGESVKSQTDSGFLSSSAQSGKSNLTAEYSRSAGRDSGSGCDGCVGYHENGIAGSKASGTTSGTRLGSSGDSISSDSESISTEAQLMFLMNKAKLHNPATQQLKDTEKKKRTSSGRSITSIEMEGDSLVIVTEEIEDSAFAEEENIGKKEVSDFHTQQTPVDSKESCNVGQRELESSSDSSCADHSEQHYQHMLSKLTAKQREELKVAIEQDRQIKQELEVAQDSSSSKNESSQAESNSNVTNSKARVDKLKGSLELKLNVLTVENGQQRKSPIISITPSPARSTGTSCSTPTSGPDSCPPSPVTPPEYLGSPQSMSSEGPGSNLQDKETPEGMGVRYNFSFPHNAIIMGSGSPGNSPKSPKSAQDQLCGVFSVDLGEQFIAFPSLPQ